MSHCQIDDITSKDWMGEIVLILDIDTDLKPNILKEEDMNYTQHNRFVAEQTQTERQNQFRSTQLTLPRWKSFPILGTSQILIFVLKACEVLLAIYYWMSLSYQS
jgi:hypothetical protein